MNERTNTYCNSLSSCRSQKDNIEYEHLPWRGSYGVWVDTNSYLSQWACCSVPLSWCPLFFTSCNFMGLLGKVFCNDQIGKELIYDKLFVPSVIIVSPSHPLILLFLHRFNPALQQSILLLNDNWTILYWLSSHLEAGTDPTTAEEVDIEILRLHLRSCHQDWVWSVGAFYQGQLVKLVKLFHCWIWNIGWINCASWACYMQ